MPVDEVQRRLFPAGQQRAVAEGWRCVRQRIVARFSLQLSVGRLIGIPDTQAWQAGRYLHLRVCEERSLVVF